MTTIILKSGTRVYSFPSVEVIKLDNEISLILGSAPLLPPGPGCAPANKENYDENPY